MPNDHELEFGFFDGKYTSNTYDRLYDSGQISEMFNGVIMDGVYLNWEAGSMTIDGVTYTWEAGIMAVKKAETGTKLIYVDPGKAWYKGTWTINPTALYINAAPEYSDEAVYKINQLCVHKGVGDTKYKLYKCTTAIPEAEEWNNSHWTEIVAPVTDDGIVKVEMAVVLEVNKGGNDYDNTLTYSIGDYCVYKDETDTDYCLYECNTDIEEAESWNSSHWTKVSDTTRLNDILIKLKTDVVHTQNIDDYVLAYVTIEVTKENPEGIINEFNIDNIVGSEESPYFAWILQDLDVSSVVNDWSIMLGRTIVPFISWFDVVQRMLDPDYENNRYASMYPVIMEAYNHPYVNRILPRVNEYTTTTFDHEPDGNRKTFTVTQQMVRISNVRVDGNRVPYTISNDGTGNSFTFLTAPSSGATITARLVPIRNLYDLYFEEPQ